MSGQLIVHYRRIEAMPRENNQVRAGELKFQGFLAIHALQDQTLKIVKVRQHFRNRDLK